MSEAFVPVCRPRLPRADTILPYLASLDASRTYSNHGPLVDALETRLAALFGLQRGGVVAAASGTAALVAAIVTHAGRATEARPYCLCADYTFAATALAAEQCGYRPYLADIDPSGWSLDPETLIAHPALERIGVVVVTAPYGRAISLDRWQHFFRSTGIPVVVDAAASIEAFADHPGDLPASIPNVLSLHATKTFGVGEGGAVLCAERTLALSVHAALNFGFHGKREVSGPATNGKMSEYHAAVGLAELDGWTAKRADLHAVARAYRMAASRAGLPVYTAPTVSACYALVEADDADDADRMRAALAQNGIDFRLWYGSGLHGEPYFARCAHDDLAVTKDLAPRLIGLPVAPDLSGATVERIVGVLTRARRQAATVSGIVPATAGTSVSGAAMAPKPFLRGSRTT